jgi:hypothetical protein
LALNLSGAPNWGRAPNWCDGFSAVPQKLKIYLLINILSMPAAQA